MQEVMKRIRLSSFQLKCIAIVSMIIDHMGAVFFPQYMVFRIVGRLAFPIFCFSLVEGYFHTRNIIHYMTKMLLFALVSEVPFDLLFYGKFLDFTHQNVYFTLFLGLLMLYTYERQYSEWGKVMSIILIMLVSELLRTDYSLTGLLIIFLFYYLRKKPVIRNLAVAGVNIFLMGYVQVFGAVALIPISLYSGEPGRKAKWFYMVYPVHLLLLFVLRVVI